MSSMQRHLDALKDRPQDEKQLAAIGGLLGARQSLSPEERLQLESTRSELGDAGDWTAYLALLELELPLVEGDRRVELLGLKGRVLQDELLDGAAAVAAFEEALALRPDDEDTQETVEHIQLMRANWEKIAAKYVEEAESATDRQLATSLLLSAAELIWRNDAGSARIEQYLKRSLEIEPRNRKASGHLERLLRQQGRVRELAALLETRSSVAATPQERVAALLAMGDLWALGAHTLPRGGGARGVEQQLEADPSRALDYYRRALALDATHHRVLRRLVDLLTKTEDWEALARVYEDALRARTPGELEPGMLVQIAQLYAQKLDQPERAEEYFRRVRKADPTQRVMLDFYRGYYRQQGEPSKILALLDTAQRLEKEAPERLRLAREMAQVAEQDVGNLDKAIDIWKGILRLAPGDLDSMSALKRLYRSTTPPKWNALRELLKDEIEALPEQRVDEKIALLEEIVAIYAEHLKLDVMVVNTYNAILELRPEHQPSLMALSERYEQMGRWNDLINVLVRRKDQEKDGTEKIALLQRIAALWLDKFGNHSQAIAPLEEVLALTPLESEALAKLRDIHERRRNWRGLIDVLRREAEHRSGAARRALVQEMARVAADRLGDAGEAIQVWNQLLEDDPSDREALAALADLYRRDDRWAALAEVLHRQREACGDDPEQALALLEQLGEIYTNRLRGPAGAIDVWRQVLALQAEHPKALALLRELFVQEQRWEELEALFAGRSQWAALAETLTNAADRSSESALKVRLYSRVGELCAGELGNPERAVKAYERVLAVAPKDVDVCRAVAPLYRQTERWSRLLTVYETLLDAASELDEQLVLLSEIRAICEEQLGSRQLAFQWCARAYRLAPEQAHLEAELSRLAAASEAWEALLEVYDDRVRELADPLAKQHLLRRMAELCSDALHRPEDAEQYHRQLLELDASDEAALAALEQIYSSKQRWAELVDVYRQQTRLAGGDAEAARERLFRIAFVQEERLADPAAAIDTYAQIVESDPNDLRALRSLERLYHVRGEWARLADVLRRQHDLADDDDVRVEILQGLGELLADELSDVAGAIDALERALTLDPNHRPTALALEQHLSAPGPEQPRVARLLEPIYERAEDHAKLAAVLEVLLEVATGEQERRTLLRRLQALYDRRLANGARARWAAEKLFAADPTDVEARRDLARLAEQTNKHDVFARALEVALAQVGSDRALELALRWDLAQTLDRQLGRPEQAEEHVRRIVELQPTHADAFAALERILRDKGKWQELRDVLHRRRELADSVDERRHILAQICALNEDVLGDDVAAIAAYEEMLALRPDDEEAVRALERHYRDGERWQALADFYQERLVHAASEAERGALLVKQAEVRARELGEVSLALDLLESVVASDPEHGDAVSLLELLLTEDEERRRVTEILEQVYQRTARWKDLVTVLLIRRSLAEERHEKVALLTRVARLSEEQIEDLETAFHRYRDALRLDPAQVELQDAVKRLGEQLELWDACAEAWQAALQGAEPEDLGLTAKLLRELARLQDERLEQPEEAAASYQRLLELDRTNPETAAPAARALARLHEHAQRWPELVAVLQEQRAWAEDGETRRELLLRIGRVQEDLLEQPAEAIETYVQLLDEDPRSEDALDALERLYLGSERFVELTGIYRRRVDLAEAAETRQLLWHRIAELYEVELADADETIAALLRVLEEEPTDREALRALARLYREQSRWPDLLEMLERQIALSDPESDERRELLFVVAELQHEQLGDLASALERYREVLARQPAHQGARAALSELLGREEHCLTVCEILAPLYRQDADWPALLRLHEMQAERAPSATEKTALFLAIAEIHEEQQGDLAGAFSAYRRALVAAATEPELPQLVDTLLRLSRALGRYEPLIEALEAVTNDVLDLAQRQRIHLLVAETARDELGDLGCAERHFRALLDIDAEHEGALLALQRVYEQTEGWESLLEILSRRVELTRGEERVGLLLQAAELCRDRLDRPDEAIASFERVRAAEPDHEPALLALDGLYAHTERWPDLADLLQHRAAQAAGLDEQVELYFRLAALRAEQLSDPLASLAAFRRLLALEPAHAASVQRLEAYLDDSELATEAAKLLEPIYVSRQDWPNLIRIYEIRLAAAQSDDRLALMTRIAQLYEEQLEDLEGAFSWYGKVFLESPTDSSLRDQLMRLTGILDCWEAVAQVYTRYLDDSLADDETSREIALLVGHIYDDKLYTWQPAKVNFERVLRNDPGDAEAFKLLEQLLMRHEQWQELLELYRNTLDATLDASRRRDLMLKIARVWEEALEDLPAAIDAYQQIFDESNDAQAVTSLDRLFRETERWEDLCDLVNRRMDFIDDADELIEMKFTLGVICEEKLFNLGVAIDHYEEVLARNGNHARAIAALEQLVMDREQRFRIAQILEPIYRAQDEWAKLVVIYDAQLAFIEEADRRVFLLKEIARLHEERGGSLELAFRALGRAFEEDPEDDEALAGTERLAQILGVWPEVIATLGRCVDKTYDFDLQARLLTRVAQLHEDKLGDQPGAVEAWRRVLAVREDDGPAMAALLQLLELLERWSELVETLRRKAESSPDAREQQKAHERIAELYGAELPDADKAIEAWRQVLALDTASGRALDALERLYAQKEEWIELIWVYQRKLELTDDGDHWRELQLSVARTYEQRLNDNFEAIGAYKAILERFTEDRSALDALDRLYTRESLWADLLAIVERQAELEQSAAQHGLRFRAGAILANEIGDLDGAIDRFERVMRDDPHNEAATEALEKLLADEGQRVRVALILERVYRTRDDIVALVRVLETRLTTLGEPPERRDVLMEIARLHEGVLQDQRAAFETYGRALGEEPSDERTHAELDRLAGALAATAELVDLYAARLDQIYDFELGRRIHLKVARMLEDVLDDDARAEKHFRGALDCGGEELEPLEALDRVLERQEKWDDLLEVLERRAAAVTSPAEQAELHFRSGVIRRDRNDDVDGAFASFRSALEHEPSHTGARAALEAMLELEPYRVAVLDVLEPIYEQAGEYHSLARLNETRLTTLVDRIERTELLERLARLQEERLEDRAAALEAYARALAEEPTSAAILSELERLGEKLDAFEALARRGEAILAQDGVSTEAQRELGLRVALWYAERLGQHAQAEQRYAAVLQVLPDCVEALEALDKLLRSRSAFDQLVVVLAQRAELELDALHKRELLVERARLQEDALDDAAGAIEGWRAVLEVDENDRPALEALARLYEQSDAHAELHDVLARLALLADEPAKRVTLRKRAAEVLRDRLQDLSGAIDAYRDVLDLEPTDAEALAALEALQRQREDWPAVEEVLLRRLDPLLGSARIPLYEALAELSAHQLDNLGQASAYLQQILDEDPRHEGAYKRLEKLLRRSERWYDLIDLLRRQAGLLLGEGRSELSVDKLVAIARLWNEQLENPEAAAEVLEEVLQQDDGNVGALAELARLYESTKQWDRCLEVLERATALDPDPEGAAELAFRRGRVHAERGGSVAEAKAYYDQALALAGQHREAAAAREDLARREQDWTKVAEMLEIRLTGAEEDGERLTFLRELGALYRDQLGQPATSVATWERARALAPGDTEVLVPLAQAYCDADRLDDAEPLLVQLIEAAGTKRSKEMARYEHLLGVVAERRGAGDEARARYEKAYRIDSTSGPTLVALGRVYAGQGDWDAARRIYRSMLLQNPKADWGITRAEIFGALGRVHAALGEPAKARSMLERGLEIEPDNASLRQALEALD